MPGLVFGFRFNPDGGGDELPAERAPAPGEPGWLWLHFNLADKRATAWIAANLALPPAAASSLVAHADHQQFYAGEGCVWGAFSDVVREFDGLRGEVAFLTFAGTSRLIVTGRRHPLQGVDALRTALLAGRRVSGPAALIEALVEQTAAGIDRFLEDLARELDAVEDLLLIGDIGDERRRIGLVRRTGVHLHRQVAGLRSTFNRFEAVRAEQEAGPEIDLERLVQRLDALDQEVVALQDRARLLQDQIGARLSEESARHLHVLSVLAAVFMPATLATGIFGMNTSDMPLTMRPHGSLWAVGLVLVAALAAYWGLRRSGVIKR